MRNEVKLKIGAFSKMMQVTVKTLRHYEQMGLLVPAEVDEWTGYRYLFTHAINWAGGRSIVP